MYTKLQIFLVKIYHLLVAIALKSGSLNLLEAPGPVQACTGISWP